jgi:predicted nuclease of predicted toxin-antitoxin system
VKLFFDQNLSQKLLVKLADLYPNSTQAITAGLEHGSDGEIWNFAEQHGYVIVTADTDFEKLSAQHGFPPKVILLTNCNYPTRVAADLLRRSSIRINEFEKSDSGLLVLRP